MILNSKVRNTPVTLCQKSVFVKKKIQTFQNRERRLKIEELWKSKNLLIDVAFWRENCYSLTLSYHNIWIQVIKNADFKFSLCRQNERKIHMSRFISVKKPFRFQCTARSFHLTHSTLTFQSSFYLTHLTAGSSEIFNES